MRPGSGARMGTAARMGTGSLLQGNVGMASAAAVQIADRPMTMQGLGGVRVATAGPGRQVQDTSFFVGVLRTKLGDIMAEIARMKGEVERANKDSVVTAAMERRYDVLLREVRTLEGDLADYNLAMDKSRTSVDASDITQVYHMVKRRNDGLRRELDAVFMERQERERGAGRLDEAAGELQRAAEARINSLPPPLVQEYRALVAENRALAQEAGAQQGELEQLNAQIEQGEGELRRDRVRDEYALAEKRLTLLKRERASLEQEMAATRLNPAEARDKLLAKVKEDNARIQALDKQLRAVEEAAAARRKAIAEVTSEIEERRGEAGDSAKYEVLFKRDQEMTEFIDRFPEMRDREQAEQRRMQNLVTALLEHCSEGIERERSMPSKEAAEEMKDDLDDKRRELKASEMTADRLQEELQLRQTELEKINTLDTKITAEIKGLQERMAQMKDELAKFADIPGLRVAAEEARRVLQGRIQDYQRRREALRPQVAAAASEYERKRAVLAKDATAQALDALETKLKNYEQTVFGLKECA
jgi:intraflagellar transport protein 74